MTSPLGTLQDAAEKLEDATQPEDQAEPTSGEPSRAGKPTTTGMRMAALYAEMEALRIQQAIEEADQPFTPHAAPGSGKSYYQVQPGQSLQDVADTLGLASPYHDLFQPNMAGIEEAAHKAGYLGGSDQGSILPPGTWLEVPAYTVATNPEIA